MQMHAWCTDRDSCIKMIRRRGWWWWWYQVRCRGHGGLIFHLFIFFMEADRTVFSFIWFIISFVGVGVRFDAEIDRWIDSIDNEYVHIVPFLTCFIFLFYPIYTKYRYLMYRSLKFTDNVPKSGVPCLYPSVTRHNINPSVRWMLIFVLSNFHFTEQRE